MARVKSGGFSKRDEELARAAKGLAAPAKVAIMRALARRATCICGEIVEITPLSQSTVSQHLKELKELGLIQGRIEGVKSCYCINRKGFLKFTEQLLDFINEIKRSDSGKERKTCKEKAL
jgi:ArsR family transcriptional regulator, arsenate/arsenite/antimonite-responsive transcriptional repressor